MGASHFLSEVWHSADGLPKSKFSNLICLPRSFLVPSQMRS